MSRSASAPGDIRKDCVAATNHKGSNGVNREPRDCGGADDGFCLLRNVFCFGVVVR